MYLISKTKEKFINLDILVQIRIHFQDYLSVNSVRICDLQT
jgi:hypothetical protein